jgi:hypothetical protein
VFPAGEHAFRNADGDGEELVQPPAVVVAEGGVVRLVGVVLPIPSRAEGVQDADALLGDALPVATMVVAGLRCRQGSAFRGTVGLPQADGLSVYRRVHRQVH